MLSRPAIRPFRAVLNLLLIALLLFQQIALPATAAAAPAQATTAQASPAMRKAQAEANFYAAFNGLINLPADAPPAVLEAAQKNLEQAAAEYQRVVAEVNALETDAASVQTDNETFDFTTNTQNEQGQTNWTMLAKPQGDRATFDNTFTTNIQPDAQPPAVINEQRGVARIVPFAWYNTDANRAYPNPNEVILFDGDLYNTSAGFNPVYQGLYSSTGSTQPEGTCNDCVTSIRVGRHVYATLYDDGSFGGASLQAWGDVSNLGGSNNFNDRMSSIKVEWRPCSPGADQIAIYTGDNWSLECEVVGVGDYGSMQSVYMPDNTTSSIAVGSNVLVKLYSDDNLNGYMGQITSSETFQGTSRNDSISSLSVLQKSDLTTSIVSYGNNLTAGSDFSIRYRINNIGSGTEPNATINVNVPSGITYLSGAGCSLSGSINCNLGGIGSGSNTEIEIFFRINTGIVGGLRTFTATPAGIHETNTGNNSTSHDMAALAIADLGVTTTAPQIIRKLQSGDTIYQATATVTNYGSSAEPATRLGITLPSGASVQSASATQGSCVGLICTLGSLAINGTATATYQVRLPATATEGDTLTSFQVNASTTDSYTTDLASGNNNASSTSKVTFWDLGIGATSPGGDVRALLDLAGTIYAAGTFGIKRWNGTSWEVVGTGAPDGTVYALLADGSGGLYAAGDFTNIGPRLARWDGTTWSAVAGGIAHGVVYALARDAAGDLYVGGQFTQAGTLVTNNIARWDGTTWYSLGIAGITQGIGANPAHVRAIAIDGENVYVGGLFRTPGNHVAQWNKTSDSWAALSTGMNYPGGTDVVTALAILDSRVYAGGAFATAGGVTVSRIAAWDPITSRWQPLGSGIGGIGQIAVNALAVSNGELLVGGSFTTAGGATIRHTARWNGASWAALGGGMDSAAVFATMPTVSPLTTVVGGSFTAVDTGVASANIARYHHAVANVAVTQSFNPAQPVAGQTLDISYLVSNPGTVAATNVALRAELPVDASFVSATPAQGSCAHANGVVTCDIGTLNASGSTLITVQVNVAAVLTGPFTANAWVGSRHIDSDPANNRTMGSPNVLANADLVVSFTGSTSAVAGTSQIYNLSIQNNGPAIAVGTLTTITLPAGGATFVSATGLPCEAIRNYADDVEVRCNLGNLATGGSASGTLSFDILPETLGTLNATAVATSSITDPSPANASQSVATTVSATADLTATLRAPGLVYLPGGQVAEYSYQIELSSAGPSVAQAASAELTLPASTTFVSASAGCSLAGQVVTCAAGELPIGENAIFDVNLYVNAGTANATSLAASVTAQSSANDPSSANNTASATTTVSTNPPDARADLQLTMLPPDAANAGESAIFTLEVFNAGAVDTPATITNLLPAGTTFDASLSDFDCVEDANDPTRVICEISDLGIGFQRVLEIAVTLAPTIAAGVLLTNSASVTTPTNDPALLNNSASVSVITTTSADLVLSAESSANVVSAGETVTVTLTLTNDGPSQASDLLLENPQPDGMVLVSADGAGATCQITNDIAECAIPTLAVGETLAVEVVMTAGSGEITNTTTLSSSTDDPDTSSNTVDTLISIASVGRTEREFGAVVITADTFIDLPSGAVQAFGNVWLGEHLTLAGETDSIVIDGEDVTGEGTIQYLQEGLPVFTGDFTGTFELESATLIPADDVQYELTELVGFELVSIEIDNIDLLEGRVNGRSDDLEVETEGFSQTLTANFFVAPGLSYGGTIESFTFTVSEIVFEVTNATITDAGLEAENVSLTLPPDMGGIAASADDLMITADGVSIGGAEATIPLPDFNLSGEEVQMTEIEVTIVYDGTDLILSGEGLLVINLPDNMQQSQITFSIASTGDFSAGMDQLTLDLAGSQLELQDIGVSNDGLSVAEGVLTLPESLNESVVTIREVTISADGIEIGGGAVEINIGDIDIGDGSKVRFSEVTISLEIEGDSYTFGVETVLQLRLPQNSQDIQVTAQINTEGEFEGTLNQLTLRLASTTLILQSIAFDNTGLSVGQATMIFPPNLGNVQGALTNVRIDAGGLSVGGGGASIPIPDFKLGSSNGFSVTNARARIDFAADRTYKLTLSGTVRIAVKSIDASAAGSVIVDSQGNIRGTIDSFSVNIAGLSASITNARLENGTLFAGEASLETPASWGGAAVAVYNLRLSTAGISIGGGRFKLPDISTGSLRLGGLEGELREEGNGYVIALAGSFLLPGLGGPGCALRVNATMFAAFGTTTLKIEANSGLEPVLANPTTQAITAFELRQVGVGLVGCRIPISGTPLYLTRVAGQLTLTNSQTVIDLGVTVATDGNIVEGNADLRAQFNPFQLDFEGSITVFSIFKAAELKATTRAGYFSAELMVRQIIPPLEGRASLTAWTQDGQFFLIGRATLEIGFRKGALATICIIWCLDIPPIDTKLAELGAEFGKFKKGNDSVWGLKGWASILDFRAGFYFDQAGSMSITNIDQYQLVTPPGRSALAQEQIAKFNKPGQSPPKLNAYTVSGNDYIVRQQIAAPGDLIFVMERSGAVPTLSLIDPAGTIINPTNLPGNIRLVETPVEGRTQTLYIVQQASAGLWQAVLKDAALNDDYLFTMLGANPAPLMENISLSSTGAASAELSWNLTSEEPDTRFDIYITPGPITTTHTISDTNGVAREVVQPYFSGTILREKATTNLDGSRTTTTLDLSEFRSGTYWIWLSADDERNPPTRAYAPIPVYVTRPWSSSWQSSPILTPGYRSFEISWAANANPDAEYYRVEVGTQPGLVEEVYEVGEQESALVESLTPGQVYYFTVIGVNKDTGQTTRSETISAIAQGATVDISTATPNQTVIAGASISVPLSVATNVEPYPGVAFLKPGTLPDGISLNFATAEGQVTPTTAGISTTVEIQTTADMVGGVYDIPIQVLGEGSQDEVIIQLTVQEPRIQVNASPATATISTLGGSAAITLDAVAEHGATGMVEFDLLNVPAGMTYSFGTTTLAGGASTTLLLTDTQRLANGIYSLQIRSERGLQQQFIPVTITIQKPVFHLEPAIKRLSIVRGENAIFAIPVSGEFISQAVNFSLAAGTSPVPDGIAGFAASPTRAARATLATTVPSTPYLIMETAETTPVGTYRLLARAQAHGLSKVEEFEVTVLESATTVDLGVSQSAETNTVVAGDTFTYTVRVANYGPLTAEQVTLTNTLPAQVALVSIKPQRGSCAALVCSLGTIRRGTYIDLTVVVQPNAALPVGTVLTNHAVAGSAQAEANQADNSSLLNITTIAQANLQTSIIGSTPEVVAGGTMSYTLRAWNSGPSNASEAQLIAQLPQDVEVLSVVPSQGSCFRSLDGRVLTCDLGTLTSQVVTIQVNVRVSSAASSSISLASSVRSATSEREQLDNATNLTTRIRSNADLVVTHSVVAPETAVAGDEQSYQLLVSNTGSSDAPGVILTNQIPDQFVALNEISTTQGFCGLIGRTITCQLGTLKAGESATITIRGEVDPQAGVQLTSIASVSTAAGEVDLFDNTSTREFGLSTRTDLRVSSATPTRNLVQFLIDNDGPSQADGVILTSTIPNNITLTKVTSTHGTCSITNGQLTCTIGTLQARERAVISIEVSFAEGALDATVEATVTGTRPDPRMENNTVRAGVSFVEHRVYLPIMATP